MSNLMKQRRREKKPQQDEDLKHDSAEQKQILQFEQVRYQPKVIMETDIEYLTYEI